MNQWLISKRVDIGVLLLPVWLCWLVFFLLPEELVVSDAPLWVWVVFVIGIDVSHVWSTLFRTYTDPQEYAAHRLLLVFTPILCFLAAFLISTISFAFFWRCLAYLAVFHFIKQQYGFMRIYKAKSGDFKKKLLNDNFTIYFTMLYPILYWHLNLDRNFYWFVEGDFIQLDLSAELLFWFHMVGNLLYFGILGLWLLEEVVRPGKISFPKVLWVLTTAGNWFIGIVYFNSDLVFTITNVVAHGVPYMALVIFYQSSKRSMKSNTVNSFTYSLIVIVLSLVLAFSEEYLWDLFVYREHTSFFSFFLRYPDFEFAFGWQHIALAILSVPQTTHYVLDGFIWKNNDKNPQLKSILLR